MSDSSAYEHGTTRPNNPSVEAVETASDERRKARQHRKDVRERRPTEPLLEWDRGPERKTAVAPMLMRAEQIDPSAWLDTLRRRTGSPTCSPRSTSTGSLGRLGLSGTSMLATGRTG